MTNYQPKKIGIFRRFLKDYVGAVVLSSVIGCGGGDSTPVVPPVVPPVNKAPVALDDNVNVDENSNNNLIDVLANDSDKEDGVPTLQGIVSGPSNGSAVVIGNQIDYTPNTDFDGSDEFTYEVKDKGGKKDTANVSVTIINIGNAAPEITSSPLESVVVNTAYNYDVDASDLDGDTLNYEKTIGPGWMSINSSTGEISGIPTNLGVVDVTAEVTDGEGGSDTQNYKLVVSSVVEDLTSKKHGVIIIPQAKIGAYSNLIALRKKKGLMFEEHTIEDIVSDPEYSAGRDTEEKIRMHLQNLAGNYGVKFAVLDKAVPLRKVLFSGELIPTILYYSDIDDGTGQFNYSYNWDVIDNSNFGELADGLEFTPYIWVSVFPENISGLITNIEEYETNPNIGQLEKMLMMATPLDALTDTRENAELIIANYLPAHIVTGIAKEYNTGNVSCRNAWSLSPAIVKIDGHGEKNAIGALWIDGTPPTTENLLIANVSDPNLTNDKIPCLVYNASCHTANTDTVVIPGRCIGEILFDKTAGKFLVYGGHTKTSIAISGSPTTGPAAVYAQEFFRELFDALRTNCYIGEVFAKHKIGKAGPILNPLLEEGYLIDAAKSAENGYRKAQFTLLPIGPSATDIFTKYEGDLNLSGAVNINTQPNYLEIVVDDGIPIKGAKVCIDRNNGTEILSTLTNDNGRCGFNITYNPATDKINVSKHNWIPYFE